LFLIFKTDKAFSNIKNRFLILKWTVRCHVGTTAQSACAT